MVWRLQLILSDHLTTQGNHLSSNFIYIFSYPQRSCIYRTKLINVASKCGKKAKAKMLEAILEHNVHVWVPNVHIWGPNVHIWLLKNSGYNLIFSFFTKIGLDSYFWYLLYIYIYYIHKHWIWVILQFDWFSTSRILAHILLVEKFNVNKMADRFARRAKWKWISSFTWKWGPKNHWKS